MRLISKTEFSKITGVSQAAISRAVKSGALRSAVVRGRIDMDNIAAVTYLERHRPTQQDVVATSQDPSGQIKTAALHLKIAEQTKLLISRDLVSRCFGRIRIVFADFVDSHSSAIALSICRATKTMDRVDDVEEIIRKKNAQIIADLTKAVEDEIRNF